MMKFIYFSINRLGYVINLFLILLLIIFIVVSSEAQITESSVEEIFQEIEQEIIRGNLEKVELLFRANPDVVTYRDNRGLLFIHRVMRYSPLFMSRVSTNNLLELFLKYGADINAQDINGNTPLHIIIRSITSRRVKEDIKSVISFFIDNGADINIRNRDKKAPLDIALEFSNFKIADILIESGADYSIHTISELGRHDIATSLITFNPKLVHSRDSQGRTPLHCVAGNLGSSEIQLLLDQDFKPSQERDINNDQLKTVQLLLDNASDINSRDKQSRTPLHCVAQSGRKQIGDLLIAYGADINIKDEHGDTPLHIAARQGHPLIVELLFDNNATIDSKNAGGETPLICAQSMNHKEIITMLRGRGAEDIQLDSKETWRQYLKDTYSDNLLAAHLLTCDENPTKSFTSWYISDVYNARRNNKPSLLVIQLYDGTRLSGFKLGCLIVFDNQGKILKTIGRERVDVRLLSPDFDFNKDYKKILAQVKNKELIELPDINDDGFAEIPTQSWENPREKLYRTSSIYLTETDKINRVFTVEYHDMLHSLNGTEDNRWPLDDIEVGVLYLCQLSDFPLTLVVMCQPMKAQYSQSGRITGARSDESRPHKILEKYMWDAQQLTFVGPKEGPNDLWKIVVNNTKTK